MTITAQADFVRNNFVALLKTIPHNAQPLWGKMSLQHMAEHMVLVFKNANGSLKTEQFVTPDDKLAAFQDFLRSDKEFRENTKSPALPGEPMPLRQPGIPEVIAKLEKEVAAFFDVYENNPGLQIRNPVFGDLDYDLAIRLMYKHCRHHLRQFGVAV